MLYNVEYIIKDTLFFNKKYVYGDVDFQSSNEIKETPTEIQIGVSGLVYGVIDQGYVLSWFSQALIICGWIGYWGLFNYLVNFWRA